MNQPQSHTTNPMLEQMQDLSLPPEVASWPPAPWVWPVALALLLGIMLLVWWGARRYIRLKRQRQAALAPRNHALQLLKSITTDEHTPLAVSALLKRTALAYFPRTQVASLTGNRWVEFLQNTAPNTPAQSTSAFALLGQQGYRPHPLSAEDCDKLKLAAECWLKELPPSTHLSGTEEGAC